MHRCALAISHASVAREVELWTVVDRRIAAEHRVLGGELK
jgi:hypothetical protein